MIFDMTKRKGRGGGTATEEGSFTIASNYITQKTIAHGLNSDKILGFIYLEPTGDEVIPAGGYQVLFGYFMTHAYHDDIYEGKTLVCNYTSSSTKTAEYTETSSITPKMIKSPWTNEAAKWTYGVSLSNMWVPASLVTNDEFQLNVSANNTYFKPGTYRYKLWRLED